MRSAAAQSTFQKANERSSFVVSKRNGQHLIARKRFRDEFDTNLRSARDITSQNVNSQQRRHHGSPSGAYFANRALNRRTKYGAFEAAMLEEL
jgi:hypothetical protein